MTEIGPFQKVGFNTIANINVDANGNVHIKTGTDTDGGSEYVFGVTGTILVDGQPLSTGGGTPVDPDPNPTPAPVPAWTVPTLLNNWKAYPVGPTVPHEAPGFRVVGHRVELTGSLAGGEVVGSGVQPGQTCVIFRLPVGARPVLGQKTLLVSAPGNTVGTIKVFPDGQVVYVAGSLQGEISLHGLSFTKD